MATWWRAVRWWPPGTPSPHPVVTEVAGRLRFDSFIEGVTVQQETDEVTGLKSLVVIDPKQRPAAGKDLRPMVKLLDENEQEHNIAGTDIPARYFLPAGAIVGVADGADVGVGDVLAHIRQESSKTRDIAGGLPRVADLFEARRPRSPPSWRRLGHHQLWPGHQGQAAPGHHHGRR